MMLDAYYALRIKLIAMDARHIILRWPNRAALAADAGRSVITVHSWWRRNALPADIDCLLVEAARLRGIALSFEELARLRARRDAERGSAAAGDAREQAA